METILLPRFRQGIRATIVSVQPLPELAREVALANGYDQIVHMQQSHDAVRVRLSYEFAGQEVEEDIYCVLLTLFNPMGNLALQNVERTYAVRARKGHLDGITAISQTMINSTKYNLQWFNRYAQLCRMLTDQQMQAIAQAGQMSRIISQTNNEISDMVMQQYETRNAAEDRIAQRWSETIRGVETYHHPEAARTVELPGGYNHAWANNRQEYIVSSDANFDPNVETGETWQALQRRP